MTTIYPPTGYPTALDTFAPPLLDNIDEVIANHPNTAMAAVVALETKLGIDNAPAVGLGGVSFDPTGQAANPGAGGSPTIWVDNAAPGFPLMYTDDLGVNYSLLGDGGQRRRAVINIVDCTAAPPTEVLGDRYIIDNTVGAVHANWDGAAKNDIVQFDGVVWITETPIEGWVTYVDTANDDYRFIDDGVPTWEIVKTLVSLNDAYDNGSAITADAGAVQITVPDTSNNVGLEIIQNDVTNNPYAIELGGSSLFSGVIYSEDNANLSGLHNHVLIGFGSDNHLTVGATSDAADAALLTTVSVGAQSTNNGATAILGSDVGNVNYPSQVFIDAEGGSNAGAVLVGVNSIAQSTANVYIATQGLAQEIHIGNSTAGRVDLIDIETSDGDISIISSDNLWLEGIGGVVGITASPLRFDEVAKPTRVADKGFRYAKDVSGVTEAYYMDDDAGASGREIQMTDDGYTANVSVAAANNVSALKVNHNDTGVGHALLPGGQQPGILITGTNKYAGSIYQQDGPADSVMGFANVVSAGVNSPNVSIANQAVGTGDPTTNIQNFALGGGDASLGIANQATSGTGLSELGIVCGSDTGEARLKFQAATSGAGTSRMAFEGSTVGGSVDAYFSGFDYIDFRDGTVLRVEKRVGDPSLVADRGQYYTQDVGGVVEAFYFDDDGGTGNAVQLTNNGKVNGIVADTTDDQTVQTTDATVTTIATYSTLASSQTISMKVTVWARQSGGIAGVVGDSAKYIVEGLFERSSGDVVTSKDENFISVYEDQAAWDVTFVISSQDIQVKATGETNKDIEWRCQLEVSEHG